MKTLQVTGAYALLKLAASPPGGVSLVEQVQPHIDHAPHLILDVEGILFTSMLIGEMVNVHRLVQERWKERAAPIALVNLSGASREVFERTHLVDYFALRGSVAEALHDGAPQPPGP